MNETVDLPCETVSYGTGTLTCETAALHRSCGVAGAELCVEASSAQIIATVNSVESSCITCSFAYAPSLTRSAVWSWPAGGSTLDSTEVRVAVAGSASASNAQLFFGVHECAVTTTGYFEIQCPACDAVGGRCFHTRAKLKTLVDAHRQQCSYRQ